MTSRHRDWPRQWLMTDERLGNRLWEAIDRLPDGQAGIVFRHYSLEAAERADLAARVGGIARERGNVFAVARDERLAKSVVADLIHNPAHPPHTLPFSQAVHSLDEADIARKAGAALVFVSPLYPTRSHPGQVAMGAELARRIAERSSAPAIALGGINAERFARLERKAFYGWAGIDAWLGDALRT